MGGGGRTFLAHGGGQEELSRGGDSRWHFIIFLLFYCIFIKKIRKKWYFFPNFFLTPKFFKYVAKKCIKKHFFAKICPPPLGCPRGGDGQNTLMGGGRAKYPYGGGVITHRPPPPPPRAHVWLLLMLMLFSWGHDSNKARDRTVTPWLDSRHSKSGETWAPAHSWSAGQLKKILPPTILHWDCKKNKWNSLPLTVFSFSFSVSLSLEEEEEENKPFLQGCKMQLKWAVWNAYMYSFLCLFFPTHF